MMNKLVRKSLAIIIIFTFLSVNFLSNSIIAYENQNQSVKRSLEPGDYFRFILVDNRIRSYRLHIPSGYDGLNPMPVVINLHGDGFPAVNSFTHKNYYASDMDQKADEEGFISVYPNGKWFFYKYMLDYPFYLSFFELLPLLTFSRQWNHWDYTEIDDVGFIRTLIEHLKTSLKVNSSRIYITGLSGGAMMTYQLGSELSDVVAAIAPVAGASGGINALPEPDNSLPVYTVPKPDNPVPIMIFYGMNDISYSGGWLNLLSFGSYQSWGYFISAEESVLLWTEYNNCSKEPEINETCGGNIIIKTYSSADGASDVVWVIYVNGDHEWFKSPTYEIPATDLIWDFFEKNPKKV